MSDIEITCPHCNADLRGNKIPENDREFFGGKEYFSRLIGIEDDSYDGVSYWCCPECWTVWDRFTGKINTTIQHTDKWFTAYQKAEQCKDSTE